MKFRIAPLLLICLSLLFSACEKFTAENFAKIQTNQTEDEVRKLIGPPTSISSGSFLVFNGTIYKYEHGDKKATLVFNNGRLVFKEGELGNAQK